MTAELCASGGNIRADGAAMLPGTAASVYKSPVAQGVRVSEVITRLMAARGRRKPWTWGRLKDESGVSYDTLTEIKNDRPGYSLEKLNLVAQALGTTLSAVLDEADPKLVPTFRSPGGRKRTPKPAGEEKTGVAKSAVRIQNRTRYDQAESLDNSWTTLTGGVEAEERGMPDDPNFASLKNFWPHLDDGQRAEVVAVAAKIYGHRKRVVGGSPGNE